MMGIDDSNVYVFWTEVTRTGVDSGAAKTYSLYFPLGRLEAASTPVSLRVPADYTLEYEDIPTSSFKTGERAVFGG